MADPDVSVIIPARDAGATLGATLAGLAAQRGVGLIEVIVIDSGPSAAQTRELVAALRGRPDLRVAVLHNPGGEPAGSRNQGARAARAAALAFTDADCVPEPDWLMAGLGALADADLVQGRVLPAQPPGRWDRSLSVGHASGLFETANLFVRRELFDRVGGFRALADPGAGRPFGEDVLFGWAARRLGARTDFCAAARVRHAVFPRGPRDYVAEQRRRGRFPALVREVPELRAAFLHRRLFLSPRTARFDLAGLGVAAALLTRRRAPALAALPYLALLPRRPRDAAVEVAADGVGAVGLLVGSLAARTPVL